MRYVTITDLIDVIHYTIIKKLGKNEVILKEIQSIQGKISGDKILENYSVEDTEFWKSILKQRDLITDSHSLEYWKKRCELAEKVIGASGLKQDIALLELRDFVIGAASRGLPEPEVNILVCGINEIKALDAYVTAMRSAMDKVGELTPGRSQDFDNLFMHINNLKMLAGITEGLCSSEERERAIKFMDETILRKDNQKGFCECKSSEPELDVNNLDYCRKCGKDLKPIIIPDRLHELDEAGEVLSESFKSRMDHINLPEPDTIEELAEDMNEILVKLQERCESMKSWANEVSERYLKFNKGTKWQD